MTIERLAINLGYLALVGLESYAFVPRKNTLAGLITTELRGNTRTLPLRTRLWIKLPLALTLSSGAFLLFTGHKDISVYQKVALVIMAIVIRMLLSSRMDQLLFWRKDVKDDSEPNREVIMPQAEIEKRIHEESGKIDESK
jgi:hypothetical protein